MSPGRESRRAGLRRGRGPAFCSPSGAALANRLGDGWNVRPTSVHVCRAAGFVKPFDAQIGVTLRVSPAYRSDVFPLDPSSETQATHWSVISRARRDSTAAFDALEQLASQYRDPVRDYVAAIGYRDEAEDLTQDFFARKFLRESFFRSVHRGQGSFRTFLKLCVKRFVIDHHRRRRRPGEEPGSLALDASEDPDRTPPELQSLEPAADRAMDQAWARSVIELARQRLREELSKSGKEALGREFFRELDQDPDASGHQEIASRLGLSAGAVTTSFYRFRLRLQHLIREEIAATVVEAGEVESERQQLRAAFTHHNPPGSLASIA